MDMHLYYHMESTDDYGVEEEIDLGLGQILLKPSVGPQHIQVLAIAIVSFELMG